MKTILVDMDGVLAQWENGFVKTLNLLHPEVLPVLYEDRRGFYIHLQYPEEHRPFVLEAMNQSGLYADLEPIEGAIDAMNDMQASGLDVAICTSPFLTNLTCASDKYAWVDKYFGPKWASKVIVTKDKTRVRGDILIDDKANIRGSMVPSWKQLIFDASYNQEVTTLPRLINWADWQEAVLPMLEDK